MHLPRAGGIIMADIMFPSFNQAKTCQREKKGSCLPNGQVISFVSTIKRIEDTTYLQSPEKVHSVFQNLELSS